MSTVLVVDDQVSLLHTLEQSLIECGYDVMLATTGGQALKRIEQHAADIVILDLGLPDMGGMEVLTRIRGWSTVPVIVLSARSAEIQKVAALDAGADDYPPPRLPGHPAAAAGRGLGHDRRRAQ